VVNFTSEEEIQGQQLLAEMGIKQGDWFVCFHARDSAYHGSRYSGGFSHHDFRDASIDNYLAAAHYIAELGGYAIRMGAAVAKPLPKHRHFRIIDYAIDSRNDFMDIYLSARCKFFLGSTSGLYLISTIFGVPTANANYVPIDQTPPCAHDLFIPKKLFSIEKGRFLTFSEIFDSEIATYNSSEQFAKAGIRVVENTSDEILGLASEMYARLSGVRITKEEVKIREKYFSRQRPYNSCYYGPPIICVDFLKRNLGLLNL
jgi:putative glycosyltransferase (TIGR04372 family)